MNLRKHSVTNPPDAKTSPHDVPEKPIPDFVDLRIARSYVRSPQSIDIRHATAISDNAARLLAKCPHPLPLDGLTILSNATARALSRHRAPLSLGGLKKLPEATARILSHHHGKILLNGLHELSAATAHALSTHQGALSFRGLTPCPPTPPAPFLEITDLSFSTASAACLWKRRKDSPNIRESSR